MTVDISVDATPATAIRDYIVTNFLFGDGAALSDDASLVEAGALDSTGVLELVAFIEEHFGIAIDDRDLVPENLESISRIAAFVTRRRQQGLTAGGRDIDASSTIAKAPS